MKKLLSIIFTIIFSFMIYSSVLADETDDWGTLMKDYQNNSDFGKIITNPEFQKAIETRKNLNKKSKKKDKKNKKNAPEKEPPMLDIPSSSDPLLTLPFDVYYENKQIKQGFYLVNSKYQGEKYFLELKQGNNSEVAVIEAKRQIVKGKNFIKPEISVEKIDDNMIKINYTENDYILECVLWILVLLEK